MGFAKIGTSHEMVYTRFQSYALIIFIFTKVHEPRVFRERSINFSQNGNYII